MTEIKIPKKLIEVALPLDDINLAAGKEKSIRQGHPSTLHLWWARRPLAAARAVLFAQMVNDPGYQRELGFGVNKQEAEKKREELFGIIRDLVKWENSNNEDVLERAKNEIWNSWREICHLNRNHPEASSLFDPTTLPGSHDPFAGGGTIPLEAQRLGLNSSASDLNPVPIVLNKAMIELPGRFKKQEPLSHSLPTLNAKSSKQSLLKEWDRALGIAEDVRYFGEWIRSRVEQKINSYYPKVVIDQSKIEQRPDLEPYLGQELNVIAWIWARTVPSPNPAFNRQPVPLASSFVLSSNKSNLSWVEPVIKEGEYTFEVKTGTSIPEDAKKGTKAGRGGNFTCLLSGAPIPVQYIREQGKEGKLGSKLMGIVLEGKKGRVYISPSEHDENIDIDKDNLWQPSLDINHNPRDIRTQLYGLTKYSDLFTDRQLLALNAFSHEVSNLKENVSKEFNIDVDGESLAEGGGGTAAYLEAISVYLGLAVGKAVDYNSTLCSWISGGQTMRNTFGRQAIPMVWDFAEANPIGNSTGCFVSGVEQVAKVIEKLPATSIGHVEQADATNQTISQLKVVSCDPPYFDNIAYADLADYFYVWMRKTLRNVWPDVFGTMAVPKAEELVASPHRHGDGAESFFMNGMTNAMKQVANQCHPAFPTTIYYAFKQSDTKDSKTSSSGWETFLEATIGAGFGIQGTWPMRTERESRTVSIGSNALASSIILVCNKRAEDAETISRRHFQRELKADMPEALEAMIGGESGQSPIAPVDLAQAAIGPGMAIYSKYDAVLNQDGSKMSVHDALIMINKEITDYLNPDAGAYDADTLFCSDWFNQYGWSQGEFGIADTLARAKGTSVEGVDEAGVVEAGAGKVRLLRWEDMDSDWDPKSDNRVPVWEACHQIIRELNQKGESAAGALLARMPEHGEAIRQLAYHMYTLCERKKWAEDARAYNELITAWHSVVEASLETGHKNEQMGFDL
ncbi:TPA: DUF1156 domain-containing protein [Vibrio harveyi]|nr:DUF1156 domain-containing protein [Vibrio harveyi]